MHQVQLADQLDKEAQRRASEAGFATVDEYVADVVSHDLEEGELGKIRIWIGICLRRKRLAHIDAAAAGNQGGEFLYGGRLTWSWQNAGRNGSKTKIARVILSPTALMNSTIIWRWNEDHYSTPHADAYVRFLKHSIDQLATNYSRGQKTGPRSDLRYIIIRRKAGGHGHIAVYAFDSKEVNVLHVFHTAQDWRAKLIEEPQ